LGPPIVDRVDFFYRKRWLCWDCSLHQKCSVDLKYAKNASAAGAPPRTPLGSSRRSPDPIVGRGEGHPSPIPTSSSPPLSAPLTPRAQLRCPPPNVKSWLRRWYSSHSIPCMYSGGRSRSSTGPGCVASRVTNCP